MKRRSRWKDPKPVKYFGETDLEICRLLAPGARAPWGYQYLPSNYFAPLLHRGKDGITNRLPQLRGAPHYLELPEQPHDNYRQLIYKLGKGGAAELRTQGYEVSLENRAMPHELMACLIAASFEIGAAQHNLPIEFRDYPHVSMRPDWPIFTLNHREVFIEADTGSETIERIEEKCTHYLELLYEKKFRKPLFLFITAKTHLRPDNMVQALMRAMKQGKYHENYAERFAFGTMDYDRYLNTLPKPSGWAVTQHYQRANFPPFSFAGDHSGRQDRTDTHAASAA